MQVVLQIYITIAESRNFNQMLCFITVETQFVHVQDK